MDKKFLVIILQVLLYTGLCAQQSYDTYELSTCERKMVEQEADDVTQKIIRDTIYLNTDLSGGNISKAEVPDLNIVLNQQLNEVEQDSTCCAPIDTAGLRIEGLEELIGESAKDIRENMRRGATLEEAIVEEIIEEKEKKIHTKTTNYGQHLFKKKSIELFRTAKDAKAPDHYILGEGDEIIVNIFGTSQNQFKYVINNEGYITPKCITKTFLKGVTLGDAKELLQKKYARAFVFHDDQFALTLLTARVVNVNVLGKVENPGSYPISAMNTAVNVLMAAGGITEEGSLRNIKLISGESVKILDLYEYMNNPAIKFDYYLKENDIIVVPDNERVISIEGAIQRPHKYELATGENLAKLIDLSGGVSAKANKELVQINRYTTNDRIILDIPLDKIGQKDYELYDGDVVTIKTISDDNVKYVEVEGAVYYPGKFAFDNLATLRSLVKKASPTEEAKLDLAFLLRKNNKGNYKLLKVNVASILADPTLDLSLQNGDKLLIYKQRRFVRSGPIKIIGAVRKPGVIQYDADGSITLEKALLYSGGLEEYAADFAYIFRRKKENEKEKEYIRVNVKDVIKNPSIAENYKLEPHDIVKVFSRVDFSDVKHVEVLGAVRQPQCIEYDETLTLLDALTIAGGLRKEAALNKIEVSRLEITQNEPTRVIIDTLEINEQLEVINKDGSIYQLNPFDQIVVRKVPDFEFQENVYIKGEVVYPGTYTIKRDNERLLELINRAGGLTKEAFEDAVMIVRGSTVGPVITEFDKVINNPRSRFNYIMKDGDTIIIPKKEELVHITVPGTNARDAYSSNLIKNGMINVAYFPRKRARWYIREYAAGISREGRKTQVSVEYPNGQVKKSKNLLFFVSSPKVKKGSKIKVGLKKYKVIRGKRKKVLKGDVDWDGVLRSTLTFLTTIISFILVARSLNN